jgi:protein-tyrosine phosphatase
MDDFTDLHSHLVPAVDDGCASVDESLESLAALRAEGVAQLVTTPHLLLPRLASDAAVQRELDVHMQGFEELAQACAGRLALPAVALGQEIWAPDAAAIRRVLDHPTIGLAGGRYLLVEFGFQLAGTHMDVVDAVLAAGRGIVIAHPERYHFVPGTEPLDLIRRWRDRGALLQMNVGSLGGHYAGSSPESERLAWAMIEADTADLLATDHHGPRRDGVWPRAAFDLLDARGRGGQARRLLGETPSRIARSGPPAQAAAETHQS